MPYVLDTYTYERITSGNFQEFVARAWPEPWIDTTTIRPFNPVKRAEITISREAFTILLQFCNEYLELSRENLSIVSSLKVTHTEGSAYYAHYTQEEERYRYEFKTFLNVIESLERGLTLPNNYWRDAVLLKVRNKYTINKSVYYFYPRLKQKKQKEYDLILKELQAALHPTIEKIYAND